jgi:DNA-binding MarR family transcriptional regulator
MPGTASTAPVAGDAAEQLAQLGRQLGAATVMYHSQVAEKLGISVTDHKCLDLAMQAEGPLTAGRIAELSGLSTGAVTGVLDRLERLGYVRRVRDERDRRKVYVQVAEPDWPQLQWIWARLGAAVGKVAARYTAEQLKTVASYLADITEVMRTETAALRDALRAPDQPQQSQPQ